MLKYWRNLCLRVFLTRLSAVRGLQVDKGGCCRNPEQGGSTNMKPWSEEIQEKPEKCLKRRKLGAGGSERRPAGRVTLLLVGGSVVGGRWVVGGRYSLLTSQLTEVRRRRKDSNPHPQSSKLGQWVSRQDGQQAVSRWIGRALRQTADSGQAVSGGVYLRSTRPARWLGLVRHWQILNRPNTPW